MSYSNQYWFNGATLEQIFSFHIILMFPGFTDIVADVTNERSLTTVSARMQYVNLGMAAG
jgi:hypothetical protein